MRVLYLERSVFRATVALMAVGLFFGIQFNAVAGTYTDSSHGNSTAGVDRSSIDTKFSIYAKGNCAHCHEQHASIDGSEPVPVGGAPSPYLGFAIEQDLCFECHDSNGPAPLSADVKSEFSTLTYKHGQEGTLGTDYMEVYDDRHRASENASAAFSSGNRHAECADCHNPHEATATNPLQGAKGINVTNGTGWTEPTYSINTVKITSQSEQYKVCFKCHSGWAGYGTGTNQAQEYNTNNRGYHNIEGQTDPPSSNTYGNFNSKNATLSDQDHMDWTLNSYVFDMMPRYTGYSDSQLRNVPMICSDCHGNTTDDPQGVHGSARASILKIPPGSPWTTWDNTISIKNRSNCWCFNCHDPSFTNSGFSGNDGELHTSKHAKDNAKCMSCHVRVPHGWDLMPKLLKPQKLSTYSGTVLNYTDYQGTSDSSGVGTDLNQWPGSGNWTENDAKTGTGDHQACN